jgi:hypothetical protein
MRVNCFVLQGKPVESGSSHRPLFVFLLEHEAAKGQCGFCFDIPTVIASCAERARMVNKPRLCVCVGFVLKRQSRRRRRRRASAWRASSSTFRSTQNNVLGDDREGLRECVVFVHWCSVVLF